MNKKLFFIHHSNEQDLSVLRTICKALHPLVQQKSIEIWSTEDIPAGANIQAETDRALAAADWVLPLVSADYLSDDNCQSLEKRAVQAGKFILPVLLRPCMYEFNEIIHSNKQLPIDSMDGQLKPFSQWKDRDEAVQVVVRGIWERVGVSGEVLRTENNINMSHKKHLKTVLSEGKLIEAIKELLEATDKNGQKDLNSTLILLSGQYHSNENQIIKGIVSNEEYNRTRSRILYGVEGLLEDYKEMEGYIFEASANIDEQANKSDKSKDMKDVFASPSTKNKTMQNDTIAFRNEMSALLDKDQQNAIADILQKIKESDFEYDKVKYKEIENSLNPMALAMMAQSLVQSTKGLINTIK